ncbi:hypothetical protein OUZ56_031513 [Daphnia magna]|uniref:Uncharacterized protein n=1 Tax=Daphnia magna TaxID=35525 RepID=A0ABQ9ZUX5_9CRUS|nr:hypothetical protein OUZ56_031513 [Daphnia magna]
MMDSLEEITEKSLLAEEDTGTRHPPPKKKLYQGNDDGNEEKQNKIYKSVLGSLPEWQATGGSRNASRPPLLCLTEIIYTLMHALLCPNLPAVESGGSSGCPMMKLVTLIQQFQTSKGCGYFR